MRKKVIFFVVISLVVIGGVLLKATNSFAITTLSEKNMEVFFGGACNQWCVGYEDCAVMREIWNCPTHGIPSQCDGACLACISGGKARKMCEDHVGINCVQSTPNCGGNHKDGECYFVAGDPGLVCTCVEGMGGSKPGSCGTNYWCP